MASPKEIADMSTVFTEEALLGLFAEGQLINRIHAEMVHDVSGSEEGLVYTSIRELCNKNHAFGGNEIGYYFNGELFACKPAYGVPGISPIDESLLAEAEIVKKCRDNSPQFLVYCAQLLGAASSLTRSWEELIINCPQEFARLSPSFNLLKNLVCSQTDEEGTAALKLDPESSQGQVLSVHASRVGNLLTTFLFRKVAYR